MFRANAYKIFALCKKIYNHLTNYHLVNRLFWEKRQIEKWHNSLNLLWSEISSDKRVRPSELHDDIKIFTLIIFLDTVEESCERMLWMHEFVRG